MPPLLALCPARTLVVSFAAVAPAYRPVTIDRFSKCNAASTTTRTTTATITGRTSGNSNDDNNNNNSKCNSTTATTITTSCNQRRSATTKIIIEDPKSDYSQYTFPFQFQFQKYASPSAVNKNQVKSSHGGTSKIKLQVASSTNCWPGRPTGFPPSTPQLEC